MAHGRNKYQSRENRKRVRDILMREWDPIGVAGVPEASDEYDSYVGEVYIMLTDRRATSEEIAAYLFDIATAHMGLSEQASIAERSERTAAILVAMRPEFETH
jgi:hypothetical protein